jgi:hypothetical protein
MDFTLTTSTTALGAGTPSRAITITLSGTGTIPSTASFALSDGGAGGSFYPASPVTIASGSAAGITTQFVYLPASGATGTITLTVTGTGGLAAAHSLALPIYNNATVVIQDTFSGTAATDLSTHTPDVGGAWANPGVVGATAPLLLDGSGHLYTNISGTGQGVYSNATPSGVLDYDVSCTLDVKDTTTPIQCGLIAGANAPESQINGYYFNAYGASPPAWQLLSYVNGSLGTMFFPAATTPTVTVGNHAARLALRQINGHQYLFAMADGVLVNGAPVQDDTFTSGIVGLSPSVYSSATLTTTNGIQFADFALTKADWQNEIPALTYSGPSSGYVGIASGLITVSAVWLTGTTTITPSDGGAGGTFTPASLILPAGASSSGTFTYKAASTGAKSLSFTNNGGVTQSGSPIAYTASTYVPYDPTTDSTVPILLDARTGVTTSGGSFTGWANQGAGGSTFDAVPESGTVTTGALNGTPTVRLNQGCIKIPTSTALDAVFANSGNTGGWGVFLLFNQDSGNQGWFLYRGAIGTTTNVVNLGYVSGALGDSGVDANSFQAYTQGTTISLAVAADVGTTRPGVATGYRDGGTIYHNGSPNSASNNANPIGTDGSGQDLHFGCAISESTSLIAMDLAVVVVWARTPKPHEILATHRQYAPPWGIADNLTTQPYALVAEGNSELTLIPPLEGVIATLGLDPQARFNLARPGRTGADILFDYGTWAQPLLEYLQFLRVPPVVFELEGINDSLGLPAAAHYLSYAQGLPRNVPYVPATIFATDLGSPSNQASGTGGINSTSIMRNAVLADAATYGWPVADLGNTTGLSVYNSSQFSDGLHWNSTGYALGVPVIAAAIATAADPSPPPRSPLALRRWFPGLTDRRFR